MWYGMIYSSFFVQIPLNTRDMLLSNLCFQESLKNPPPSDPGISSFRVNLTEWIHSNMLRPELKNSLTMMDQLQQAEEDNWQWMSLYCKCHSIASFSPALNNSWRSECFLQSFALQNEHNGTGSHISCQVPIQHHATPSQQYENPLLIMPQLPQTTLSSICI